MKKVILQRYKEDRNHRSCCMRCFLSICFIFLLTSCEVTKRATKQKIETQKSTNIDEKKDTSKETTTVTESKREGGRLTTDILPIEDRPRDENGNFKELIQTLKDGSLTKTIYYRPDGSASVDCNAADILERIEQTISERDNTVTKTFENIEQRIIAKASEKTEETSTNFIWAGMISVFLVLGLAMFFMFKTLN